MRAQATAIALVVTAVLAGAADAQSSCPSGRPTAEYLTRAAAGGDVIREGRGFGAVSLNDTQSDVERAWGLPVQCSPAGAGVSYVYYLSDDKGATPPLLVAAMFDGGRVVYVMVSLIPHSRGQGPRVQTGRGVHLATPAAAAQAVYGIPDDTNRRIWTFASEGVGVIVSGGHVGGFVVFARGALPPALRAD
jgi:hypothetical protein